MDWFRWAEWSAKLAMVSRWFSDQLIPWVTRGKDRAADVSSSLLNKIFQVNRLIRFRLPMINLFYCHFCLIHGSFMNGPVSSHQMLCTLVRLLVTAKDFSRSVWFVNKEKHRWDCIPDHQRSHHRKARVDRLLWIFLTVEDGKEQCSPENSSSWTVATLLEDGNHASGYTEEQE